jgi:hypothetical protein
VGLVVGDSFLVVYAAVQGDVDAESQESHAASLSPRRGDHHTSQNERFRQNGSGIRLTGLRFSCGRKREAEVTRPTVAPLC